MNENMSGSGVRSPIKIKKLITSEPQRYTATGLTERSISPPPQNFGSKIMEYGQGQQIVSYNNQQIGQQNLTGRIPQTQRYTLNNGLIYEGSVVNRTLHGQGTLIDPRNPSKYIYRGAWAAGARNGFGHYVYNDGTQYRGEWKNNMKEGNGVYSNQAGDRYDGQWMQGRRHGNGTIQYANGVKIIGNWENDQLISGNIVYPNGSSYQGTFRQFSRNGQGTYNYPDKTKFVGQWFNNMKHGFGQVYFPNGDTFTGPFIDGLKHGPNSTYVWKNQNYILKNANFNKGHFESGELIQR